MSDETPGANQSAGTAMENAASLAAESDAGVQVLSNTSTALQMRDGCGSQKAAGLSPTRTANQAAPLRPSQANQSIVKALINTRINSNIRVQLFANTAAADSTGSSASRPAIKRSLPYSPEKKDTYSVKLQRVLNHRNVRSKIVREKYNEHLLETFHLEMGGNLLDLYQIAKRPKSAQFLQYVKENSIDANDVDCASIPPIPTATDANSLPGMSSTIEANHCAAAKSTSPPINAKPRGNKPAAAPVTLSSSTPAAAANPDQIVEKAKHEAAVMQRVSDLQREGLWAERRLPKVQEMPRVKVHWDYLLDEMVWLAADFAQERKWKKAAAKKCSRMIHKYFQDKAQAAQKAEKAQELHLKRVAAFIAKEVKIFWNNVEKVVEFKQNTRLEEKRKQALDQQLSFIVDQTEKYSQLLAEGMNKSAVEPHSNSNSNCVSRANTDDEFHPDDNSTDDEETIAQAEAMDDNEKGDEIEALQRESQMDFESFLSELPKDYLQNRDKIRLSESDVDTSGSEDPGSAEEESVGQSKPQDCDFTADSSGADDEDTIQEQEMVESVQDQTAELEKLNEEAEMDIEELRRKYSQLPESPSEHSSSDSSTVDNSSDDEATEDDVDSDDDSDDEEPVETNTNGSAGDLGLKSLLDDGAHDDRDASRNDQLDDVAAIAESLQPKGNTLSSTSVVTPVPFLLKLKLREYQHIGLDWLVTMFERKLNGILADEMGLGKTIQTIALLAHLACEKSNWGPHLIVVPTSVMLNWEMECKKWCPAFKILTYYGTQKERKLKRTGWTKPNTFHICITSYKLVIQDHQSFRRKKWKYLILDEAQNIKNFKSQRWQLLLNFQTDQRLLLTGTPLQNNLMELWSLMHFLMPNVFASHREFKEWFSNPVTGMIEGNAEYNENIIKRLHKVLRPFLLRRLKSEVEKQMPKKFEHVVMCRLSKRQRHLYDDYMCRAKTKETLESGNLLSVINVLMQLRKVCNHPNLFEARPIISPFHCTGIVFHIPSVIYAALAYDALKHVDIKNLNLNLLYLEYHQSAYQCYRMRQFNSRKLIEEIPSAESSRPLCPPSRMLLQVHKNTMNKPTRPECKEESKSTLLAQKVKVLQHQGAFKTLQIGSSLKPTVPGYAQLVQTSTGKHILLTPTCNINTQSIGISGTTTVMTASGQKLTVLPKQTISPSSHGTAAIAKAVVKVQVTSLPPNANTNDTGDTDLKRKTIDTNFIEQLYLRSSKNKPLDVRWHQATANDSQSNNCSERETWMRYKMGMHRKFNEIRCQAAPIYGLDLLRGMENFCVNSGLHWSGGMVACRSIQQQIEQPLLPDTLKSLLYTPEKIVNHLSDIFERYLIYVPSVCAPQPQLQTWSPNPSVYWGDMDDARHITHVLRVPIRLLHPISSAMITQFPHPRLIQYDCGKLQAMDKLLRRLRRDGHRVLIFTQMTKMLDVLEAFLNFHGHIYLRLDGSTKIDQRQILMERFNGDSRVFAFILSTRSGGVGINLTGADTVIFYDSDWNPTMDAQAQDRCHRIGQTRDVHIYRLVSEMTIEENILKKANQKRLLGDLAIEGGNFTTAYFKNSTIKDLFNIDHTEASAASRICDVVESNRERDKHFDVLSTDDQALMGAFESALAAAEDDQDVIAARTAQAEAVADLAEFDENIPLDDPEKEREPEISKAEQEVDNLIKQLTPIERYAMRFIEANESTRTNEQLAAVEREIEQRKLEWEESRLVALREEEERRAREAEEENDLLTFSRDDAANQIWVSHNSCETMPMWCPPTPPQQGGDMYVDNAMCFLYDSAVMTDNQLPPVYTKKEPKRNRSEAGLCENRRPAKHHKRDDETQPPKSLFNRLPLAVKMRRDAKLQKHRSGLNRAQLPLSGVKYAQGKAVLEQPCHSWTINEDAAMLKVIQGYQGLNLNLNIVHPGHTPNWDFVGDYINSISVVHRSSKQCRAHYETVLIPREEGKQVTDAPPKKKKQKGLLYNNKSPAANRSARSLHTSQLYIQDNNSTFNGLISQRFDVLKTCAAKRPATSRSTSANTSLVMRNPKHESILTDAGIDLEHTLSAIEITSKRAERIAREKKATPEQLQLHHKLQLIRQVQAAQAAQSANNPTTPSSTVSAQQVVSQPLTVSASLPTAISSVSNTTLVTTTSPSATLRMQRIVATSPLQNSSMVSVSGISPAQLQAAAQRLIASGGAGQSGGAKATVLGTGSIAGKAISPAQLQMIRQATLKHQQLRLQSSLAQQALKATTTVVTIPGQSTAVQVQFTQAQPRAHIIKGGGGVAVTNKQIARTMTESEVAQLLKLKQSPKIAAQQTTSLASQHVFAQSLQTCPSATQVATIVKAVSSTAAGSPPVQVKALAQGAKTQAASQLRTLQIPQQLITQKKLLSQPKIAGIAQVAAKSGIATQLIVGPKQLSTAMTMQQFQQVIRSPLPVQQGPVVLTTKGASRIVPVNSGQSPKSTIQVVTASPSQSGRSQSAATLNAIASMKVQNATATSQQQQAMLSAALSPNVRQSSPVRIQTSPGSGSPVVAVSVHGSQSPNVHQTERQTDNVSRQVKKTTL